MIVRISTVMLFFNVAEDVGDVGSTNTTSRLSSI
jgi:hypothetical protein